MELVGYQARELWLGKSVVTLADVWPKRSPEPTRAAIVGLNPAPSSVAAGHYYQGRFGQRQLLRLAEAGLFVRPVSSYFEDAVTAAGIGLTDLVKRPTVGEKDVTDRELTYGRSALVEKLTSHGVKLVVCVFRQPADAILRAPSRVGFQTDTAPWGGQLFRMPGPFSAANLVAHKLQELGDYWTSEVR